MKNMKKRLGSLLLSSVLLVSLCCPALAAAVQFPDAKGHWAQEVIQTLAEDGIICGYADGKCHPDDPIARGQFSALVARVTELAEKQDSSDSFTDTAGHWSAGYVNALIDANVLRHSEYGDTYEPDKLITRMEMIRMMVRAIGKEDEALQNTSNTPFADDAEIAAVDKGFINTAVEYDILRGFPDNTVRPYQGASRAEGFCMLVRMRSAYEDIQAREKEEQAAEDKAAKTSSGRSHSYSVPAPEMSFTLPATAYVGESVSIAAVTHYASGVTWSLTHNGSSTVPDGLTAQGGTLIFAETGTYTLKAAAANSRGQTAEQEQTVTVYPVVGAVFSLPAAAHTDTALNVELLVENGADAEVAWSLKKDGEAVELADVASGTLDSTGGTIQLPQVGEYELTASVTDTLGKVTTCAQSIRIYPVVQLSVDLPAVTHMDESIPLFLNVENADGLEIVWTATKDGDEITPTDYLMGNYEDQEQLTAFAPGTYTLTATVTDAIGRSYTASDTVTVYPVGSVGFFLPTIFHTDDTVTVEATITELANNVLNWALTRNGEAVAMADCTEGTLTAEGGALRVKEQGRYTLAASYTDGGGRTYQFEQSFTVYPVPTVKFSIPKTAWTDTQIPVEVQSTGTEDVSIEWLVDNTYGYQDWNTFVEGRLTNEGGTIRFKRAGSYELVARIMDVTGRVFLYEQNAECEVQPVLDLRFDLPAEVDVGEIIDLRTSGNNNVLPVEWSLTRDGQSTRLSSAAEGSLNAYGGKFSFTKDGDYTLTASVTDVLGRTFSASRSVCAWYVQSLDVRLPDSCHVGTAFSVTTEGTHLENCSIAWELTDENGEAAYEGELGMDGGKIKIMAVGAYTLTATVTDPRGRETTAQDTIRITNEAPAAPQITAAVDYADSTNPYTASCKVKANITLAGGTDPDGDSVTYEYAADSAQTGYYGQGTYTVKARTVDQWGSASAWTTRTFSIQAGTPSVTLSSRTLGSSSNTTSSSVDFSAAVSGSTAYKLAATDYYNAGSRYSFSKASGGGTLQGQFSSGRHLLVVQAKDLFGKCAYASRFFVVGSAVGSDTVDITSMSTTVEEGLYDGNTPLAYIKSFSFKIPAISGHSSGCNDTVVVYGETESGTTETVVSFSTNDGFLSVGSDGTYQYTDSSNNLNTVSWAGWNSAKYTRIRFNYTMASGHESCLANATSGLTYTVEYSFIESSLDNMEALFD